MHSVLAIMLHTGRCHQSGPYQQRHGSDSMKSDRGTSPSNSGNQKVVFIEYAILFFGLMNEILDLNPDVSSKDIHTETN